MRPRVIFVAIREDFSESFEWPRPHLVRSHTIGEVLYREMSKSGWSGVEEWRMQAKDIAPTLVGGSKKHGGPDLGPTRSKKAWAGLGVDGHGLADEPPGPDFIGMPRLTVKMAALLQGFPDDWYFCGRKTPAYRQVGNAFPPPVARAVGETIAGCINVGVKDKEVMFG